MKKLYKKKKIDYCSISLLCVFILACVISCKKIIYTLTTLHCVLILYKSAKKLLKAHKKTKFLNKT